MAKSLRGRDNAAPFFGSEILNARAAKCAEPRAKVSHRSRTRKGFLDGVVDGERVLIATPRPELEKGIEIRIRVALAAAGVMVMKHHVDNRKRQGAKQARTGLGLGVSDLVCVVPPYGRFLGIEIKRPGYSPSDVRPAQKKWLAVVRRFNGVTGIATSVEEALELVELARKLP